MTTHLQQWNTVKLILSKFFKNGHFPLIRTSYELSNKYVIDSPPSISFTRNNDERLVYYKSMYFLSCIFFKLIICLKNEEKIMVMMTSCIKQALIQTIHIFDK